MRQCPEGPEAFGEAIDSDGNDFDLSNYNDGQHMFEEHELEGESEIF